jgi:threonylcarbamoyladenosine tRNA methylthiotransferase MtaB
LKRGITLHQCANKDGEREITFKVITFGCPVNRYESTAIESAMQQAGFINTEGRARVNIINSCVVTGSAAAEARRVARKIKREDPQALVVLAGCYPQVYHRELAEEMPETDILVGTKGRSVLPALIRQALDEKWHGPRLMVLEHEQGEKFEEMPLLSWYGRVRPVVKIQEGCNEFCTYCIIRKARGRSRSLPPDRVLKQVRSLLEAGYREIILAGNQLGLYGQDLGNIDLPQIIEEVGRLPYDFRIRLNYVEPVNVTERLLETVAFNSKVCNHLYIPVQSCSDRVLKRMGRKYRAADFAAIVGMAKSLVPGISVWTDLIVGFPGEEEADHDITLRMIRELGLAHLHVFPYSPRPGTPAARFADNVRPDIKNKRVKEMQRLDRELSRNYNGSVLGKKLRVLVEKIVDEGRYLFAEGYADNYVSVRVPLEGTSGVENKLVGQFVNVLARADAGTYLAGTLI